jgi:hypothetical protein
MKQTIKNENLKKVLCYLSDKAQWIATILLLLGFIILAINSEGTYSGKSFHQLTIAPILLLMGYSLFIFVVMKKLKD